MLKNIRGALYRRIKKKPPLPKTRSGQMLEIMRSRAKDYPKFFFLTTKALFSVPSKTDLMKKTAIIYPLIKPYTYASVRWNEKENEVVYHVVEPSLSTREEDILGKLKQGLVQTINISIADIRKEDTMLDFLEKSIRQLLDEYGYTLNEHEYMKIMYYIFRDFVGLNEIEPLLRDPYIEDIGLDGIGIPVYIVHQKFGSIRTNIIYKSEEHLREFVTKISERCDRYISYAEPLLDGTLPDGTRIQASLASDVTTRGPTFSIRKFREAPFSPIDMLRLGTVSPEMLAYIWFVIENGANIMIAGGVATGKTSMLNSLSLFIPHEAKIVSIEDTRELNLMHENWIPGVARAGFTGSGVGEVTMFELLKESFRQNPDYLIVGEIRGKEAYVMFQGMASGHASMSTMHAGSVEDLVKRLETKPINISSSHIESLDIVIILVHAREKGKSARRVKEIDEIESIDIATGKPFTRKVFVWQPAEDSFEYKGSQLLLSKISTEKGISMQDIMSEIARRKKFITWMLENNITKMDEVMENIKQYHTAPEMKVGQ